MSLGDHDRTLLSIDAPWLDPLPRPRLDRVRRPKPDPAQAALQSAIVNAFDVPPRTPYAHAAISAVITGAEGVPAAGALKLIIDAVVAAGLVRDDRNEVLAARLNKAPLTANQLETVNVAVLERTPGDSTFIRELWPSSTPEPVSAVVALPRGYNYVTGLSTPVTFDRESMSTPAAYSEHLSSALQELGTRGSMTAVTDWTALHPDGLGIAVRMPMRGNFDPDNVLLYVLDLLETARRQVIGVGGLTIDQLASEVWFVRSDEPGIEAHVYQCSTIDEEAGLPYFRNAADSILNGWPVTDVGVKPEDGI